ncbi:MAG: hypothetical protein AB7F89_06825 [Pirellulaceae bacterium]
MTSIQDIYPLHRRHLNGVSSITRPSPTLGNSVNLVSPGRRDRQELPQWGWSSTLAVPSAMS